MANVFIEESTMQAIGDAIRTKTGKEDGILPANMPAEIESIQQTDLYPAKRVGSWLRLWDEVYLKAPIQVEAKETATSIVVISSNNWLPLQDANGNNIYDNNDKFIINNGYRLIELGAFYPPQIYRLSLKRDTTPVGGKYLIEFYNNNTLAGSGILEITADTSGVQINNIVDSFNKIRIYSGDTAEAAAIGTATFSKLCLYSHPVEVSSTSLTAYYTPKIQRYSLPQANLQLTAAPTRILSNDNTSIEITYYRAGENWDNFWNSFQIDGTRSNYNQAFATGWQNNNFKPKYIEPLENGTITSGVSMFSGASMTRIDFDLDLSNCTNSTMMFNSNISLRYIKSIKFNNAATTTSMFASCKYLVTIGEIKGEIDFNLGLGNPTGLDIGTVTRIINALANHKDDGVSRTLTLNEKVKNKLTEAQIATITQEKGWNLA